MLYEVIDYMSDMPNSERSKLMYISEVLIDAPLHGLETLELADRFDTEHAEEITPAYLAVKRTFRKIFTDREPEELTHEALVDDGINLMDRSDEISRMAGVAILWAVEGAYICDESPQAKIIMARLREQVEKERSIYKT